MAIKPLEDRIVVKPVEADTMTSHMVSAVSATRRRAPGGSFIWPNTSTVLSMTPDSDISR